MSLSRARKTRSIRISWRLKFSKRHRRTRSFYSARHQPSNRSALLRADALTFSVEFRAISDYRARCWSIFAGAYVSKETEVIRGRERRWKLLFFFLSQRNGIRFRGAYDYGRICRRRDHRSTRPGNTISIGEPLSVVRVTRLSLLLASTSFPRAIQFPFSSARSETPCASASIRRHN